MAVAAAGTARAAPTTAATGHRRLALAGRQRSMAVMGQTRVGLLAGRAELLWRPAVAVALPLGAAATPEVDTDARALNL